MTQNTFEVAVWHKIHLWLQYDTKYIYGSSMTRNAFYSLSLNYQIQRTLLCLWELAKHLCRMYTNFARFKVSEVLMSTMKVFWVAGLSNWATGSQALEGTYHLQSSGAPHPLCVKLVNTFKTSGISDPATQDNSLEEWIMYEICWHWNVCVVVNIVTCGHAAGCWHFDDKVRKVKLWEITICYLLSVVHNTVV